VKSLRVLPVIAACLLTFGSSLTAQDPDILVADFEQTTYRDWQVTGDAFGAGPAEGTLPNQMPVSGFEGRRLVNSFFRGDATTGTLTSPEFTLSRRYLRFLIGGGGWEGKTCLNLLVDGNVVCTASGRNTNAGGSERLESGGWDVERWSGKAARLEIVDQATGGWGHINVDQIVLTDEKPPLVLIGPTREITAQKRYLHLPVKNGATGRRVTIDVEGDTERFFDIELADRDPDWWAFLDISAYSGKKLTIRVDRLNDDSQALETMEQSDSLKSADNLYHEALRPQIHFTARRGWNNDPNGMVYFQGEYHLFFQHNPYGTAWGNMHWGHAVSRDLVHWRELAEALYPDAMGPMFSGSAVVDWQNSSKFQQGQEPPLVLIYTAAGNPAVQCLAYSNDRGRTWTKYAGNPVLGNITEGNRDPKVIWFEPTRQWIMTLYVRVKERDTIQFFASPDLKQWEFLSQIEGFYECPDFFELAVDGDPNNKKWLLTGANSTYMLGSFDGRTFHPETPILPGHRGKAFYAAQTFSDIPAGDGRRIQIGWGQMPSPGMPFNQMMCFPCRLTLRSTADGPRLAFWPVREIGELVAAQKTVERRELKDGAAFDVPELRSEFYDVEASFQLGEARQVGASVRGIEVVFDADSHELICGDHRAPLRASEGRIDLRILVDRTSVEIFADQGLLYVPLARIPETTERSVSVFARGGTAQIITLQARALKSIWAATDR
jgi:fructan beta-fructosidase